MSLVSFSMRWCFGANLGIEVWQVPEFCSCDFGKRRLGSWPKFLGGTQGTHSLPPPANPPPLTDTHHDHTIQHPTPTRTRQPPRAYVHCFAGFARRRSPIHTELQQSAGNRLMVASSTEELVTRLDRVRHEPTDCLWLHHHRSLIIAGLAATCTEVAAGAAQQRRPRAAGSSMS